MVTELSTYASLARQLDSVRRGEQEFAAGQKRELASGRKALDQLVDRLTEQQAAMHQAGFELRLRMPKVDPAPSTGLTAREALAQAERSADTSDRERENALLRAQGPRLLPGWSVVARNTVIYSGCAVGALVVQVVLALLADQMDPATVFLWSFIGLPMIAFFTGYFLVGFLGVPRIAAKPAERDQHGFLIPPQKRQPPPLRRTPKLGLVICLASTPLFFLLLKLAGF